MSEKFKQAQITELPFPECVRTRPGMYLSSLNQATTEIVDNSTDEAGAGFCTAIAVKIDKTEDDNISVMVRDNGRGIPVGPHSAKHHKGKSQVEVAMTTLHAGGKFGEKSEGGYTTKTGGMHGVGASSVNATSESMDIFINCDGKSYEINFEKGKTVNPVREIGTYDDESERGTTVRFTPDKEIWADNDPINYKKLGKRLKQLAFLNPKLLYYYVVESEGIEEEYYSENGFSDYIEDLTKNKTKLIDTIYCCKEKNNIEVQVAMCYVDNYNEEIYSFVNNMETIDKGDHHTGFIIGLSDAIKEYCDTYNLNLNYKSEDTREGIVAAISIKVNDPNFEGQAKTKLKMLSVKNAVREITQEAIGEYFDKNPASTKAIIAKIEQASKAREAAKQARDRARANKEISQSLGKAEKLADCSSKKAEECEIFIVEGDSAGGSAKQARDRRTQAILPVFGKMQNVERAREIDIINNVKFGEINKATRLKIGEECDIKDSRYAKIISMSDADVDGAHIQCLTMTYFYRFQKPIIEAGMFYLACPPLFKATLKDKSVKYLYDIEEKEAFVLENDVVNIQRFKGLGEMNPDQLWETTMNPETRKLIRVTVEDCEEAEAYISLCMSDAVAPRRAWIMENAMFAEEDM